MVLHDGVDMIFTSHDILFSFNIMDIRLTYRSQLEVGEKNKSDRKSDLTVAKNWVLDATTGAKGDIERNGRTIYILSPYINRILS